MVLIPTSPAPSGFRTLPICVKTKPHFDRFAQPNSHVFYRECLIALDFSAVNTAIIGLLVLIADGHEMIRDLFSSMLADFTRRVPLVMFTNTNGPGVERQAQAAGISAVFSKIASPTLLIEAVSALLS